MEMSAIDELYGDLGQGHPASVLNYDEDSLDIYSGLEDSPSKSKNNGKTGSFLSPNTVKESLDLYEELITEEQEEKDATYNELKGKFVAAQNQVQDLLAKLQQMQTKNSSLHQENTLLKKNICALIKTAKMEIVRKDEEISKLSKRMNLSGFHPYARERRQDAFSRRLPGLNSPVGPVKESQDLKKVSTGVSQGRTLNQPGDSSSEAAAPALSVVLRTCNHESPLNRPNKDSGSLDLPSNAVAQEHRRVQSNKERESTSSNSETSTRQNICDETDNRKGEKPSRKESTPKDKGVSEKSQTKINKNRLVTEQRESVKGSCGSESGQHQQDDDLVPLRRSGRSRSPVSSSTPEPSRSNADTQNRKEELRHKRGPERQSRHTEVSGGRSEKSSSDKSHRTTEKRETREQHRKEDTRKRTRSDKEYEYKKTHSEERHKSDEKNSNRAERRSTRSETGKEHERQSAKDWSAGRVVGHKADKIRSDDGKDRSRTNIRENRRHASPVKPHRSAQNQRKDQEDKRRTSGRTVQEESSRSKASSRGVSSYLDSDKESIKGKGSGRGDKDKQIAKDKGSMTGPDDARIPKMNENKSVQGDVLASAGRKSPPRLTTSCDGLPVPEESSPKRKLTFMETLNLTVSPIKKHHNSERVGETAVSEQPPHSEFTLVSNSTTERSLFDIGEEFCVIDEIKDDTLVLSANPATQPCDEEPSASLEVKEPELPQRIDEDLSKTSSEKASVTDSEMQEDESVTKGDAADVCSTNDSQKSVAADSEVSLLFESAKPVASPAVPLTDDSQASAKKDKEIRRIDGEDSGKDGQTNNKPEASIQNEESQQEVNTSVMETTPAIMCSNMDSAVSLEVVSSTVTVENNQETITSSDTEITQSLENLNPCPGPLVEPSAETINTTAQEEIVPSEQASSSEPDSTENEMEVMSRPPQSVAVPHDEDSMMLTLSNIKVIPEAISPLTSPVRQVKKSQQQRLGKETHVKSLSKDFSTSVSVADKDAVKMDMNKENKRPDSVAKPSLLNDQQEGLSSTATEEDLEEGEIISESEGEGTLVIQSPPNEIRSGLMCSPRSPGFQKKSKVRPVVPPARKEQEKNYASKGSPSSNKRRFKTVTIPPKVKISSCADFMKMLSFIRSELRRKYMKLHKNVPKPAFCCIIEMSQASFTEFVDSVNFHKFCCQGNKVKSRLNKIICSVTSKVSNNGIVNRIFEQRAEDLKQKLWNFVDNQFDFLFKELKAVLKSDPGLSKNKPCLEGKQSNSNGKEPLNEDLCRIQPKEPLSTTENRPEKKIESEGQKVQERISSLISVPCRGLGSSGKNIKATMEEGPNGPELPTNNQSNQLQEVSSSDKSLQEVLPVHENRTSCYARRLSHSGSTHDRSDFEILTEQQASSLTFNLVSDSQMGDIFRCLLQGSDLLETVDNHSWPLNTPRKDCQAGTSLIGIMTPSKMITPQKLLTSWTSISPYKYQVPLNPALLDENCMLEVPSNPSVQAVVTATSHQPFSILAEDLAVSLTIPSPLKSDGHLSFLHPANEQQLCTPTTIISAHYSEDALLDGEDATEQDIHLSLETDNSSSPSTASGNWGVPDPAVFQFKPNLPMQAEVMEKSNDHFIVRIRHTSLGIEEEPQQERKETPPAADVLSSLQSEAMQTMAGQLQVISNERTEAEIPSMNTSKDAAALPQTTENPIEQVGDEDTHDAATGVPAAADSEHGPKNSFHKVSRKRKKHHSAPKAKRSRREKSQDKPEKQKHKKRSRSSKDKNEKTPVKKIKTPSPQLSPNSLSAKNIIRKKGEVVVTWTREEDRDILVALKTKGASSKTFATLSSKLRKSQAQVEERFTQLMKLFKKKEKMET